MLLKWEDYLDRVYGCWLGKCLSATIGAPYVGYKGWMDHKYNPSMIENILPNDNIDMQILLLDVIEKAGANFVSRDLAGAFYRFSDSYQGRHGNFRKNYELGIMPPLSGQFNNKYNIGPLRSEIWACLGPGDAKLATELVELDACIDHFGESIIGGQYLAALESLAFMGRWDLKTLVVKALDFIDDKSRVYELVGKLIDLCNKSDNPYYVFGRVLRDYGHPEYANMYQNLGIIVMALLLGKGDFIKSTILALNAGFDTASNCSSVGAIIGIVQGGRKLIKDNKLGDKTYKLGINIERRSDKIFDLALDYAYAGLLFLDRNRKIRIRNYPEDKMPVIEGKFSMPIDFNVTYKDDFPAISPGESKNITIKLDSKSKIKTSGTIKFDVPEGFTVKPKEKKFRIGIFNPPIDITVTASKDIPVLMNKNIVEATITLDNNDLYKQSFGLSGASLWEVYGPFWEKTTQVPPPKTNESYYKDLGPSESKDEKATKTRQFHLNMKADWKKEYLEDQLLGDKPLDKKDLNNPAYLGFPIYLYEDKFSMEDLFAFSGPCVAYLVRDVYAPSDMTASIQIGHSDVFRLWVNGNLVAYSDETENWTPENIHRLDYPLKRGLNRFVVKLVRTSGTSDFSIIFTESGPNSPILTSLGSGKL